MKVHATSVAVAWYCNVNVEILGNREIPSSSYHVYYIHVSPYPSIVDYCTSCLKCSVQAEASSSNQTAWFFLEWQMWWTGFTYFVGFVWGTLRWEDFYSSVVILLLYVVSLDVRSESHRESTLRPTSTFFDGKRLSPSERVCTPLPTATPPPMRARSGMLFE